MNFLHFRRKEEGEGEISIWGIVNRKLTTTYSIFLIFLKQCFKEPEPLRAAWAPALALPVDKLLNLNQHFFIVF